MDDSEELVDVVRRIVAREIAFLDEKVAGLSDDDVKKLASLALILQRVRTPAGKETDEGDPVTAASNEQLMRKAG